MKTLLAIAFDSRSPYVRTARSSRIIRSPRSTTPAKAIRLTGTLAKVEWTNPHTYFYLDVKEDNGEVVRWGCEGGAPGALSRRGFKRGDLKLGDTIIVDGYRVQGRLAPDRRQTDHAGRRPDCLRRVRRRWRPAMTNHLLRVRRSVGRRRHAAASFRYGPRTGRAEPDRRRRQVVEADTAHGKRTPDLSGYWKGTRDTRPGGNIGKDLPGWKLPLTPGRRGSAETQPDGDRRPRSAVHHRRNPAAQCQRPAVRDPSGRQQDRVHVLVQLLPADPDRSRTGSTRTIPTPRSSARSLAGGTATRS